MHGQPRKALKQEDEAALSAKAEKLRSLQAQFLANHHNNIYSKETLDVSATQLGITESSPFNIFSLIIPIPIPTLSSKMSSNLCVLILIVIIIFNWLVIFQGGDCAEEEFQVLRRVAS